MISPAQFFEVAEVLSRSSTCTRLKVGALLVRDRRIISTGYNGAPAGMTHCYHPADEDRPCVKAVHAEVNCIAFAAKHGVTTDGATLYSTHAPCFDCAKIIINAGIVDVHYKTEFRENAGIDLLKTAGIVPTQSF